VAGAPSGSVGAFEVTRRDPPIGAETRFAAGQLAESRGSLPQAAEQYQQALKLDPKHTDAMFHLGVVYAGMKKFPEAVAVWKRYIKATGDSPEGYGNLGFCYELGGRPEEAEQAYQRGIKRDPSNVACHVNYGLMLVRRGRVGEGKLQLGAVLKPAEVHYNLGSLYESQGRKEQAKAEYRQALRLDPQFTDATTRLGEIEGVPAGTAAPAPPETGLSKTE
jgi:tetratricopeptide (TPR) repeat protein